ncbi:unnamed protein product [Rhizopus microsporus]
MTLKKRVYATIAPQRTDPSTLSQKRRNVRACDFCRIKKTKCIIMEGYKTCKNCILAEEGCTYNIPIKKRGPPSGYAESLENKLQRIESILTKASSSRKRD